MRKILVKSNVPKEKTHQKVTTFRKKHKQQKDQRI